MMNAPLVCRSILPACVYRTVWGNCMAVPGIWCSTVRNDGRCVKDKVGVPRAERD